MKRIFNVFIVLLLSVTLSAAVLGTGSFVINANVASINGIKVIDPNDTGTPEPTIANFEGLAAVQSISLGDVNNNYIGSKDLALVVKTNYVSATEVTLLFPDLKATGISTIIKYNIDGINSTEYLSHDSTLRVVDVAAGSGLRLLNIPFTIELVHGVDQQGVPLADSFLAAIPNNAYTATVQLEYKTP